MRIERTQLQREDNTVVIAGDLPHWLPLFELFTVIMPIGDHIRPRRLL